MDGMHKILMVFLVRVLLSQLMMEPFLELHLRLNRRLKSDQLHEVARRDPRALGFDDAEPRQVETRPRHSADARRVDAQRAPGLRLPSPPSALAGSTVCGLYKNLRRCQQMSLIIIILGLYH